MDEQNFIKQIPVVSISLDEYEKHVRATEKIAAVERFIAANEYVGTSDIVAILGIKGREKKE